MSVSCVLVSIFDPLLPLFGLSFFRLFSSNLDNHWILASCQHRKVLLCTARGRDFLNFNWEAFSGYGYDGFWNLSVLGSVSRSSPFWEYGEGSYTGVFFGRRCGRFSKGFFGRNRYGVRWGSPKCCVACAFRCGGLLMIDASGGCAKGKRACVVQTNGVPGAQRKSKPVAKALA